MKLLFFIREMEAATRKITLPEEGNPRVHQILFCREGRGALVNPEGVKIPFSGGDLIFNPEGKMKSAGTAVRLVQVIFSEELFSPSESMDREALYVLGIIKLNSRRRNRISLSNIGIERLSILLENMLWEFQKRRRGYSWALRLKLIELLITVIRDKQFKIPIRGLKPLTNTHIQDVILYLNTEYMNPITVDDILDFCPLSRSHFHALFKQETGRTFINYLITLRCDRAAELLANTEKQILDIALETGFNNLSHFYHTFKKQFDESPKNYRELNQEFSL